MNISVKGELIGKVLESFITFGALVKLQSQVTVCVNLPSWISCHTGGRGPPCFSHVESSVSLGRWRSAQPWHWRFRWACCVCALCTLYSTVLAVLALDVWRGDPQLPLQWVVVSAQTVSLHAMAAVGAEFSCLSSGLLKIFSCVKDLSHCLHFILSGLFSDSSFMTPSLKVSYSYEG